MVVPQHCVVVCFTYRYQVRDLTRSHARTTPPHTYHQWYIEIYKTIDKIVRRNNADTHTHLWLIDHRCGDIWELNIFFFFHAPAPQHHQHEANELRLISVYVHKMNIFLYELIWLFESVCIEIKNIASQTFLYVL